MTPYIDISSLDIYDFGDSPELAEELVDLILSGKKTATCATVLEYEQEGASIPKAGEYKLIVDSKKNPVCIIEVTDVAIVPFCDVSESFAYDEGEGDRTHKYWEEGHRNYFERVLPSYGAEFSESMPLICQRFKVIKNAEQLAADHPLIRSDS